MGRFYQIIFLLLALGPSAVGQTDAPFWKTKAKIKQKIEERRALVVSVREEKMSGKEKRLIMSGAGQVSAPVQWSFIESKKFENLKKVSDHFKEVRWSAENSELFIHTEAFRYHARMHMKVELSDTPTDKSIRFTVFKGSFAGLKGRFTYEENKPKRTLMGFHATYEYEKLPMPAFFVEFGLEIILQRVAGTMREYLEKSYGESLTALINPPGYDMSRTWIATSH